jgi:quercetin dioxygenase-like cupin family protein
MTTLSPSRLALAALLLGAGAGAAAQDGKPAQDIVRAGTQKTVAGPAANFTGDVKVAPLWPASPQIQASGAYVTFAPGARSAWHTHPSGQRLVVVAGTGLVQEWGKPVQELHPGDTVWCPPGVRHWHGAAPGTSMTHLAVTGMADGKGVQWLDKVSDEAYRAR